MKTRSTWPALLALAAGAALAGFTGCKVAVVTVVEYAPTSLREQTLELNNQRARGALAVPRVLKYHFNSSGQALDARLNPAVSWRYRKHDYRTATLTMTIRRTAGEVERTTCELTFRSSDGGTLDCDFELSETISFLTITASATASGTFEIGPLDAP